MISGLWARMITFSTVLMDTWYAVKSILLYIEDLGKIYYCPIKSNRLVKEMSAVFKYGDFLAIKESDFSYRHSKPPCRYEVKIPAETGDKFRYVL